MTSDCSSALPAIRLSIAIATFNRADYLRLALESLAVQTLSPDRFEILVIDNRSTDHTAEVVEQFASAHPQLSVRRVVESSQGISFVRNRAIEEATGEVIVFLDDDEQACTTFAESYLRFFESYPDRDAAGGAVVPVYEAPLPRWASPYIERMITGAFDMGQHVVPFRGKRYPGVGNSGFRRTLFDRFGVFNTALGRSGANPLGGEEKDFFLRVRAHGIRYYYVPNASIRHLTPAAKLTEAYFERLTSMIGLSERIRTRSIGRCAFVRRVASEGVKWGGASVLAAGYLLRGEPAKGWYLLRMRWNISRGLMGCVKPPQ